MLPRIPNADVRSLTAWSNYHGTLGERAIPIYCTPDVVEPTSSASRRRLKRHAEALTALVDHCIRHDLRLRPIGARWSLSPIIEPDQVILDTANLDIMLRVSDAWLTPEYKRGRGARGYVPVFVQGGATISSINRRLGQIGLALQTSGASNGHRIAGCIATGTHGSAYEIGAVHDTILGVHLMVSADKTVLLQPERGAVTDDLADWLRGQMDLPVESLRNDELFHAAIVSLGALGLVHAVILEAAPLYRLQRRVTPFAWSNANVWRAIDTLDTRPLHADVHDKPYHFDLVMHPYPPASRPGAFCTMMWKRDAGGATPAIPMPVAPEASSDLMGFLGDLIQLFDNPVAAQLSTPLLQHILTGQLDSRYKKEDAAPQFPGEVFGQTSLPPGHGTSTEIFVDQKQASRALRTIYEVLAKEAEHGRHLLGGLGVRFIGGTKALLGMNQFSPTCSIELPSIRNGNLLALYERCWSALEEQRIVHTCHWGQIHGMTPDSLLAFFGLNVARWRAARTTLLSTEKAKFTFGSEHITKLGLD